MSRPGLRRARPRARGRDRRRLSPSPRATATGWRFRPDAPPRVHQPSRRSSRSRRRRTASSASRFRNRRARAEAIDRERDRLDREDARSEKTCCVLDRRSQRQDLAECPRLRSDPIRIPAGSSPRSIEAMATAISTAASRASGCAWVGTAVAAAWATRADSFTCRHAIGTTRTAAPFPREPSAQLEVTISWIGSPRSKTSIARRIPFPNPRAGSKAATSLRKKRSGVNPSITASASANVSPCRR